MRGRDYDGLEANLHDLARHRSWRWRGSSAVRFGARTRDEVLELRDAVKVELDQLIAACDANLAPLLQEELQSAVSMYEKLKARAGRLDFLDLLVKTRDLIRNVTRVRAELLQRFTHFFVDEFQDTDPLQAEILLLLGADDAKEIDWHRARPIPGKLFLVGDPKQSIYRFRRADFAIYEEVKERLVGAGAEVLHLSTSFRARPLSSHSSMRPSLLLCSQPERIQAAYVPLKPSRQDVIGAADHCGASGATPYRRLRKNRQLADRGVISRCGRRLCRVADERKRLDS